MRIAPLLASLFLTLSPVIPPANAADIPATITVTGEGRIEVTPDMATLNLGVMNEDRVAAAALAANSENLAGVIDLIKQSGIEARDIQTSGLSLNPRYNYANDGSAPVITGYVAANGVTVRVRDLSALGGLLDRVVSQGANTLNGLSFGLQDRSTQLDEARRMAVADAARKAALYAESAGVKLGRVLTIAEPGASPLPMPMMVEVAGYAKSTDVPVEAGGVDVAATVTVVYEIAGE